MKKILLLITMLPIWLYADVVTYTISFDVNDFDICEYYTKTPLQNDAKLLYVFPNVGLRTRSEFYDQCSFSYSSADYLPCSEQGDDNEIEMPCDWEAMYLDQQISSGNLLVNDAGEPNYFQFHYMYVVPQGKKVLNCNVEIQKSQKIRENVYITQCPSLHIMTGCSDLGWIVNTESGAPILNYITNYKTTRYPETSISYAEDAQRLSYVYDFYVSPTYTIGTDLFFINKFNVKIELVDDIALDIPDEVKNYLVEKSQIIINPEECEMCRTSVSDIREDLNIFFDGTQVQTNSLYNNSVKIIYNLFGRQVMTFTGNAADISSLPHGLYIVRAGDKTAKFVK